MYLSIYSYLSIITLLTGETLTIRSSFYSKLYLGKFLLCGNQIPQMKVVVEEYDCVPRQLQVCNGDTSQTARSTDAVVKQPRPFPTALTKPALK